MFYTFLTIKNIIQFYKNQMLIFCIKIVKLIKQKKSCKLKIDALFASLQIAKSQHLITVLLNLKNFINC